MHLKMRKFKKINNNNNGISIKHPNHSLKKKKQEKKTRMEKLKTFTL